MFKYFLILFISSTVIANDMHFVLAQASFINKVPFKLLYAICKVESNLDPKAMGDGHQEEPSVGLCQIKPSTAKTHGFTGSTKTLKIPHINAYYASKHISFLLNKYKNWDYVAAAYNLGSLKFNAQGLIWNRGYVKKVQKVLINKESK